MNRWATKDHYEVETEEADRLVRPAPKVKPPRRDKRREDMDVERDPDVDTDPDVARDPDLKMNFKDIGGSATRVLSRFLRADGEGLVKVRHKSTGRVVSVKPETLKEKPGEYEEIEEEEEAKPEAQAPEDEGKKPSKGKKTPEQYGEAGRALYDSAATDLKLKSILKSLTDENSEMAQMAGTAPEIPVAPFLPGIKPPEGIETLGDLQQAALHGKKQQKAGPKDKAPKEKAPAGEEPGWAKQHAELLQGIQNTLKELSGRLPPQQQHEVQEQIAELGKAQEGIKKGPEKPAKAPKPEGQPAGAPAPEGQQAAPKPEGQPGEAPKPGAKPPAGEKPKGEKPGKDDAAKAVVDRFMAEKDPETDKAWAGYVDALPTTDKDDKGNDVWFDPKSGKSLTWNELPMEHKAKLVSDFEKQHKNNSMAAMMAKKLEGDDKAREAVESMFDPESDISEKLATLKKAGHDLNALPLKKNLPELAGVVPAEVKTVGDLQRLVEGNADFFKKKEPFQEWEKNKGLETPEFAKYARENGAVEKGGKLLFKSGKKQVPWEKLSDDEKGRIHDDFKKNETSAKWTEDLTAAAHHNGDVARVLYLLGNPKSALANKLASVKSLDDPAIEQYAPALKDITLPAGMTMKDVVETAKKAFKPVPPPQRREASSDEQKSSQLALRQMTEHYPVLSMRVEQMGLHPDDAAHVLGKYQRLKAASIRPDELDQQIADAQKHGLYATDLNAIIPPKSGRNKNGAVTAWNKLTPEEQSEAYATHRNDVIATTFALRDMAKESFQKLGVPKGMADTLALAKLGQVPGETPTARELRAKPMASKLFQSVRDSDAPPQKFSPETVKSTMEAIGNDPLARRLAVAQFQANDYLAAREEYLNPDSPDHIDERDPPRNIAARIRQATESLRKKDRAYPADLRVNNNAEEFRRRVMSRIMALDPEKAGELQPEIQKMDADDWDHRKSTREDELKKWKKKDGEFKKAQAKAEREFEAERKKSGGGSDPYRSPPIKSVRQRLAEAGISQPIPPDPLPPKPPGYDLVRKDPRSQSQSGHSLWRKMLRGLTASERVAERFLAFSSCAPGGAMGSGPTDRRASTERIGIYWGVDPNDPAQKAKAVNVPHTPWQQAHARDLSETDYNAILAAAREWMKVPVLARILDEKDADGAMRDVQLRAALDLAIRDLDGGKYSVGLYPTVYNNLLAQLGGKSKTETLLTVREASGSLYTQAQGEDPSMKAAAEIRKFAAEIAAQHPGLAFDLTNLAFRVAEQEQEQQGQGKDEKKEDNKPDFLKDKDAAAKYAAVRGAVIRTAAQNPAVRTALLPVLQMLKQG